MLRICPNDFITFAKDESNDSTLEMSCISNTPITYKIQTTSPEKFRVRPRSGALLPGESVTVNILLKPDFTLSDASRDKFLIMVVQIPQDVDLNSPQALSEIWKQKTGSSADIEQHRLCCVYKNDKETRCVSIANNGAVGDKGSTKKTPTDIMQYTKNVQKQLKFTQFLQIVTLIAVTILAVAMVYMWKRQLELGESQEAGRRADMACHRGRYL